MDISLFFINCSHPHDSGGLIGSNALARFYTHSLECWLYLQPEISDKSIFATNEGDLTIKVSLNGLHFS